MNLPDEHIESPLRLAAEDARTVDALLTEGRQWSTPDELGDAREVRVAELLRLLEAYPVEADGVEESGNLVAATLARICQHQPADARYDLQADADRFPKSLRFQPCGADRFNNSAQGLRINWREALSAAALILVTVSVTIPMLGNARAQATRQACCSNLLGAGIGFSAYANDYQGKMPSIYDAIPEGDWLTTRANSANLFSLARMSYVTLETLACPWNPMAGVDPQLLEGINWPDRWSASYAYQNQFGAEQALWDNPMGTTAVLSDRNPLVDASSPEMNGSAVELGGDFRSVCHDGARQSILLSDGRVVRNLRPYVGDDNIWLPRDFNGGISTAVRYAGTEVPVDAFDSMLIQ